MSDLHEVTGSAPIIQTLAGKTNFIHVLLPWFGKPFFYLILWHLIRKHLFMKNFERGYGTVLNMKEVQVGFLTLLVFISVTWRNLDKKLKEVHFFVNFFPACFSFFLSLASFLLSSFLCLSLPSFFSSFLFFFFKSYIFF